MIAWLLFHHQCQNIWYIIHILVSKNFKKPFVTDKFCQLKETEENLFDNFAQLFLHA